MTPEQLVRKVTAITGYTHAAGVEVVSAEPGQVTLSLAKKPELLQFNGFFHGGGCQAWPTMQRVQRVQRPPPHCRQARSRSRRICM